MCKPSCSSAKEEGRVLEAKHPVQEICSEKGGELTFEGGFIFRGGVITRQYNIYSHFPQQCTCIFY